MTRRPRTDESFVNCDDAMRWSAVMARLGQVKALNIDAELSRFDPDAADQPGQAVFPAGMADVVLPDGVAQRPAIGIMASGIPDADEVAFAAQLAGLAIERECEVIILSEAPLSGFERFGFRTERIAGQTEAEKAACIEQIKIFWGMEIIL